MRTKGMTTTYCKTTVNDLYPLPIRGGQASMMIHSHSHTLGTGAYFTSTTEPCGVLTPF